MSSRLHAISRRPGTEPRGFRPRSILPLVFLAVWALVSGCWVVLVTGPSAVVVGETVTYVLAVGNNLSFPGEPEVAAEVPEGWLLQSVTYEGTVDGEPISGIGVEVASGVCDSTLGDPRPGFRRWHFRSAEPLLPNLPITGTVTLEFLAEDQPAGEFNLFFAFGGEDGSCGLPAAVTVNPQGPRFLTFLQALFDDPGGGDALAGPRDASLSPDGRHLYVVSEDDQAVAAFARDGASGELSFVEAEVDGVGGVEGLGRPLGVAVSPDGRHLYVVNPGEIALFTRDEASGELTFVERFFDDADNVALSPDGRHLYAATAIGMTVYARDEASGELTFVETVFPGGLVALSGDGQNLYAAGGSVISTFARDPESGELTFLGEVAEVGGVTGFDALALSPDGAHLYSLDSDSSAIALFARAPAAGLLGFVEARFDLAGEGFRIDPRSLAVSPDGGQLVVAGRVAAVAFERHRASGRLTVAEATYAGNLPVEVLEGSKALAFAPDSRHLYALAPSDDALLAFATSFVFTDGFESGDVSAWSSTVP